MQCFMQSPCPKPNSNLKQEFIMLRIFLLLSLTFLITPTFSHNDQQSDETALGKITFLTSAKNDVQDKFIKGVLLLHSFEYDAARDEFHKTVEENPDFAMGYWGVAMTYNHPLWGEQDFAAGRFILEKLAISAQERVDKARTPKEKGFIHAINLLYGEGDKSQRDCNYKNALQELYRHYPEDDEIAAFYALALLGSTEGERNYRTYMKAAGIVEEIYSHNSAHPGAAHYAIHSYDDPTHAPLGLRAARNYAKIAPGASHALHMPSHIFLALGLWDDVISSNKAAWEATAKHNPEGNPSHYLAHDLHALQWLSYAYLQKNEFQKSYELVKLMEKIATSTMTPTTKWYYALMRAAYINESQDWHADLHAIDMTGTELSARSSDMYINVMIALHTLQDEVALKNKINALEKSFGTSPNYVPKTEKHADYFTSITSAGITAAKIVELEWLAQLKVHEGRVKEAIQDLKEASMLEDEMSFGYGPPVPVKPAHELLGDVLFLDKQYLLADTEYRVALKRAPNRSRPDEGRKTVQQEIDHSSNAARISLSSSGKKGIGEDPPATP